MHALVDPGIASGFGVEIDIIKCKKAAAFLFQTTAALLKRGAASESLEIPSIQCSPIEQVLLLCSAYPVHSFPC